MIAGVVTADREAHIRVTVRGPVVQEQQVEAVIDRGFDGWLSLPCSSGTVHEVVRSLGITY